MNIYLLSAAAAAAATMLIHLVLGGKYIVRALLSSSLHRAVKFTLYYCWHMVTISITAISALFLTAALEPEFLYLALFAEGISAAFFLLSVAVILVFQQNPLKLPQWLLFALVAGLGAAGIFL